MRLFHLVSLFHPARQVWVAYPFCMGYGVLAIGYGRLEKRKKLAKLLQDTAKTCQYLTKFSKKCIFSPIMGNLEFCVFLYGKVVVPLQWISRETDEIYGL